LARLHLELLSNQLTKANLISALNHLPDGLNETYKSTVDRILAQTKVQGDTAIRALKWITFAKEPLGPGPLQHALAVTPESTDINEHDLLDIERIISFCCGLVIFDQQSGVVRLVHYTTQNYLETYLTRADANAEIAMTCLRYFTFDAFSIPFDDGKLDMDELKKYRLLRYASRRWSEHVRGDSEEQFHAAILKVFERQGTRDSIYYIADYFDHPFITLGSWGPANISLLHLASKHGLLELCRVLLSRDNHNRHL
jgi:hypothetical protein